jgi:hypothetical protein
LAYTFSSFSGGGGMGENVAYGYPVVPLALDTAYAARQRTCVQEWGYLLFALDLLQVRNVYLVVVVLLFAAFSGHGSSKR